MKYMATSKRPPLIPGLPADSSLSSETWSTSALEGLRPEEQLSLIQSDLECRFAVLEKLMKKLTLAPDQADQLKNNVTKTASKKYTLLEDPGSFVTGLMNAMCFLRLGTEEMKVEGICEKDSCSVKYVEEASYSRRTIYITPEFNVTLSDKIPGLAPPPSVLSREWPFGLAGRRISVHRKLEMHDLPASNASVLSGCVQRVGNLFLDQFRPYESVGLLPRLPEDKQASFTSSSVSLRELDLSTLQTFVPKSIIRGTPFTLEIRLIPSSVLMPESPDIDSDVVDQKARAMFEKIPSGIRTDNHESSRLDFSFSNYRMLKLETRKDQIESATVKLVGNDLVVTSITPQQQDARPLAASAWSWTITPTSSGDHSAYLSIEAKRAGGRLISAVIPLQIVVQESLVHAVIRFFSTNWQWVAGSLVIPGLIFLWGKFVGSKKQTPLRTPMQGPKQPRPKDRNPVKRL
ncbi:hypothetical protein [Bradyrhizobium sp. RT11b]|uniref:hypothetical protein n=1 Tax=Bradyrhizobium sp. RT11b TaxID=3156332 RepID=UPI0033946EAA